jgi:hypothetical protein
MRFNDVVRRWCVPARPSCTMNVFDDRASMSLQSATWPTTAMSIAGSARHPSGLIYVFEIPPFNRAPPYEVRAFGKSPGLPGGTLTSKPNVPAA